MPKSTLSLVCLALLALACTAPLSAQSMAGFGAINGTVRDSSGAIVARAAVRLSNSSTGLQRDLVTNESGYFIAPSLPPGPGYQVSVSMPGFELHETKGLQLDLRHRFVGTAIVMPPSRTYNSCFAGLLLNGWQLAVITTAASAEYTTPTVLVSGSQFSGMAFTNTLNGFGGGSRVPFLPRGSIPIDSTFLTDARLTKIMKIRERYQLQVHFETFNTFNHVKNTGVTAQAFTAASGVLNPTAGLGTGTASGGFPDGTNARRAQVSIRLIF